MAQDQTPTLGMPMPRATSAPVPSGPRVGGLPSLATVAPGTAAAPVLAAAANPDPNPTRLNGDPLGSPAINLPGGGNTILPAVGGFVQDAAHFVGQGIGQEVGPTAAGLLGAAGRNVAAGNVAQGVGNAVAGTALGAANVVTAPVVDVAKTLGGGVASFARGLFGDTGTPAAVAAPSATAAAAPAAPTPAPAAPRLPAQVSPFGVTYDTATGPTPEQAARINAAQTAGLVAARGGIALPAAPTAPAPALTPFQSAMAQLPDRGTGFVPGLAQALAGVKSSPALDAIDATQGNPLGTTARNVAVMPIRQGLAAQGVVQGMQDKMLAARPKALLDQMNQAEYAAATTRRANESNADFEARSAKATATLRARLILEAQNAAAVMANNQISAQQ